MIDERQQHHRRHAHLIAGVRSVDGDRDLLAILKFVTRTTKLARDPPHPHVLPGHDCCLHRLTSARRREAAPIIEGCYTDSQMTECFNPGAKGRYDGFGNGDGRPAMTIQRGD